MDNEKEMALEYFENELNKILPIVENNRKLLEKLISKNSQKPSITRKIENLFEIIADDLRIAEILIETINELHK